MRRRAALRSSDRVSIWCHKCSRILHALGQTVALKDADLDLGHVEPASVFRRIMHFQSLPNALSLLWLKSFIQAGCCMRIEIIHDQTNTLGLWVDLIDQPADRL